jgi:lysyl-tRNA synthetase class 1
VSSLDESQRQYLSALAENLENVEDWQGETLQTAIFTTTKELELPPKKAFPALYQSFLGKERGPKAGNLLSYLDRPFVVARLRDVAAMTTS